MIRHQELHHRTSQRLRRAVAVTLAIRNPRIIWQAARRHALDPVATFARAGGKLDQERARCQGTELRLGPDDWWCLDALVGLLRKGARLSGSVVTLANGRTFTMPSEQHIPSALSTLYWREYGSLDVSGSVVIDVGANIGDSAVWFADHGAVHVYAYEPFPELFAIAEGVVKHNRLTDTITVIRAGVGAGTGPGTGVYNPALHGCGLASLSSSAPSPRITGRPGSRVEEFRVFSLRDVLKEAARLHPGEPLVLKADCEGCEFDAFEAAGLTEALQPVRSILMEVHPDPCHPRAPLQAKLEAFGFAVSAERDPSAGLALVHAERPAAKRR